MNGHIDIRLLIYKIIGKWYYFLITTAMFLSLAYLYIKLTNNTYQIRASVLLAGEGKNGMRSEKFLKGMELLTSHTEIEDEIGILKSYTTVESAILKLDFGVSYFEKRNFKDLEKYGDECPFVVELDSVVDQIAGLPVFIQRISETGFSVRASGTNVPTYNFNTNKQGATVGSVQLASASNGDSFAADNLAFTIRFNRPYTEQEENVYFFVINNLKSVAESYQQKLDIKPISRESNIVEVNVRGNNPQKDILFLNTLLEVYLINELNKQQQLGLRTIQFIDEQLRGVSDELHQAENSLESFRSRNNILSIDATAEDLSKNLNRLEIDKSLLESKLRYYRYILKSLHNNDHSKNIHAPSTFGVEDPFLNDLLLESARLHQERAGVNYTTREGNPVAEVLDRKIASNERALSQNVTNFIEASTEALLDLNSQIGAIHARLKGLPKSEREMVNIQRRFDFNDNVYNYLLEKRAEAGIAIAANAVEKSIVDHAKQVGAGPVSPNKKLIFLTAFLLGLFVACVFIIGTDLMNDNIVTTEDIEKNTNIPFIGTIVHGSRRDRSNFIVADHSSNIGESFRSLRVNLEYLVLGEKIRVIGITSSVKGEGKTFCSLNLAAANASSGKKAILIEADMRRPRLASMFGLSDECGLSNYLTGHCTLHQIIKPCKMKGLDIITSGPIPPNPLNLIALPQMEELIRKLKTMYDTIIIDTPPLGSVVDYIILMKYTDTNIFVVRSNHTNRSELLKMNKLYVDKKINKVSILLNDAKPALNGYHYHDK